MSHSICSLLPCVQGHSTALSDAFVSLPQNRYSQPAGQYFVQGGELKEVSSAWIRDDDKLSSVTVTSSNCHWPGIAGSVSELTCFACSPKIPDKGLLVASLSPQAWVTPAPTHTSSGSTASPQPPREAAPAVPHFPGSPSISSSLAAAAHPGCSTAADPAPLVYPALENCLVKVVPGPACVCNGAVLLQCFQMWLIRTRAWIDADSQPLDIPRYNSCTPIKSKRLSIRIREMFLLHYAQLRAQLLWITPKLLLQDCFNHMCHLLSHFLLSSQRGKSRRDSFTLKQPLFKSATARRMICKMYKCKIQTLKSTLRYQTESKWGSSRPSKSHHSKDT